MTVEMNEHHDMSCYTILMSVMSLISNTSTCGNPLEYHNDIITKTE